MLFWCVSDSLLTRIKICPNIGIQVPVPSLPTHCTCCHKIIFKTWRPKKNLQGNCYLYILSYSTLQKKVINNLGEVNLSYKMTGLEDVPPPHRPCMSATQLSVCIFFLPFCSSIIIFGLMNVRELIFLDRFLIDNHFLLVESFWRKVLTCCLVQKPHTNK